MSNSDPTANILAALEQFESRLIERTRTADAASAARFDAIENRLDRLEPRFDGIETRLDGLESRFEAIENRLDRLEAAQTKLRTEIMARLDRQQDMLSGVRDDIAVNFGTVEDVRRVNDTTRETVRHLQETIATLIRTQRQHAARLDQIENKR